MKAVPVIIYPRQQGPDVAFELFLAHQTPLDADPLGFLNLRYGKPARWVGGDENIWDIDVFDDHKAEVAVISYLKVDPRQERKGYGSLLVKMAIADAKAKRVEWVYLRAVGTNQPEHFYTKLGFEEITTNDDGDVYMRFAVS